MSESTIGRDGWSVEQWERHWLEDALARIERTERTLLRALRCPTDPVAIYAVLAGEQPAPWPKRTAARDQRRANHAMHVLLAVAEVRRYTAASNARRAALAALRAAALAGDAALNAGIGALARAKNRQAGRLRWGVNSQSRGDAELWRAARRYKIAHPGASKSEIAREVKALLPLERRTVEGIRARLRVLEERICAPAGK